MIRWIVRVGVALIILATLGGSLATSARADSLNVDYVGWHLASNRIDVDKVELSFDADLTGRYKVTVELLGNDKKEVVSSGSDVFTSPNKEDKLVIDLSDASVAIVYYIGVTVKKLPPPYRGDEGGGGITDIRGMVVPPPEPGPPPEPEPEPTPTPVPAPVPGTTDVRGGIPLINWPVVVGGITAVVVGLLVFFLIRRKRKKKAH